ncbi:hypothetical protein ACQ4PT_072053 [Festuca glaucescens]
MAPSHRFFWAWWLPLMLAGVVADQQAEGCSGSAARCGNLTISDPFWLVDLKTGRSCGHRDFRVACYNNTLVLRTTEILGFAIIQMNYDERSLRAIDLGKLNLLNGSNRCNSFPLIWNTSAKLSSQFRISNMNQNLILYNCTEAAAAHQGDKEVVETRMSCGNESKVLASVRGRYDETSDYGSYALEECGAFVVPVMGSSSGVANASDYEQLIRDGFLLTWDDAPPLARAQEQRPQGCLGSVTRCGNLTISDPFWVVDFETGQPCGAPSFAVLCYENTPSLLSNGQFSFMILNITYKERSLHVIDMNKLRLVQASNICGMFPNWNTSVKLNPPFRISPANLELTLYNCTGAAAAAARQNGALEETRLRCGNESDVFVRAGRLYDETSDDVVVYAIDGCDAIVVPVLRSSGNANASGYEQLIKDGFLLTWGPDPLEGKFTHLSNLISIKFLPKY